MCGIIGILSSQSVSEKLLLALSRLEYRGYDSAGIATLVDHQINRRRSAGKLENLVTLLKNDPLKGNIGIGHTRWATHGKANCENAHPHASRDVTVVHNGIIENFSLLKSDLQAKGYVFESETDTEVVVHLITDILKQGLTPLQAVQQTLKQLEGAFALVILFREYPDLMIATRRGSPLVVGRNREELFVASDALALVGWVEHLCYLEEEDLTVLYKDAHQLKADIYNSEKLIERLWLPSQLSAAAVTKADYSHFMLKEIFEQPTVLSDSIQSFAGIEGETINITSVKFDQKNIQSIFIIACGTSYYAGLVAKYWFEKYFSLSTQVEIASEFRYRKPCLDKQTLYIFLSQSGETIDTLAALNLVKRQDCQTLGIVNVAESSIARQTDQVLYTLAGPEIGVASTKAFLAQLATLLGLGLHLTQVHLESSLKFEFLKALRHLPALVSQVLQSHDIYQQASIKLSTAQHALYLGRGFQYPIALEGALKLKELSYIHAEGYAAGELKHGPIALIDAQMPVVVLAPYDEWFEKTLSNMQEVLARNAQVIILTDEKGAHLIRQQVNCKATLNILILPTISTLTSPFIYTVAVQLLAYYAALHKGTDIDQPRNLAKSVTVE